LYAYIAKRYMSACVCLVCFASFFVFVCDIPFHCSCFVVNVGDSFLTTVIDTLNGIILRVILEVVDGTNNIIDTFNELILVNGVVDGASNIVDTLNELILTGKTTAHSNGTALSNGAMDTVILCRVKICLANSRKSLMVTITDTGAFTINATRALVIITVLAVLVDAAFQISARGATVNATSCPRYRAGASTRDTEVSTSISTSSAVFPVDHWINTDPITSFPP
jgi:hypothetical protein